MKMTTYQKWLRKKIKKNGEIRIDSAGTHAWSVPNGVVKITRIKYSERTSYDNNIYSDVEIDIEYRGTIKIHGDCDMGWDRTVDPNRFRKWNSTISRNKRVRSCVRDGIVDYLKYFGVNLRWSSDIKIKKVVWKENNI